MRRDLSHTGHRRGHGVLGVLVVAAAVTAQVRAPAVAGVSLGMSVEQVRGAVGKAERETRSLGMRFWEYPKNGVTVIWKEDAAGVQGVVLSSRGVGAVRGVRVGDAETVVQKQWGTPARVRQEGRFWDFTGAGWVLSAEMRDGAVAEITLMAAGAANH